MLVSDLSQRRASIHDNFISENGIVAVLGDENQFVKGGLRNITRPLSFERGHIGQIPGKDAEPVARIWLLRGLSVRLSHPQRRAVCPR
jgi:hypothetical protein